MRRDFRTIWIAGGTLAVLSVAGCKKTQSAMVKSLFGLEAGADANADGAYIYAQLTDWFRHFNLEVKGQNPVGYNVSIETLRTRMPQPFQKGMLMYLDQQASRLNDFEKAIEAQDQKRITDLLDLETLEMQDIALAILNPHHQMRTADLFAKLILASRKNTEFIDRFATRGFLEPLLARHTFAGMMKDIEAQRLKYRDVLVRQYVGGPDQVQALSSQLAKTRASIATMRAALESGTGLALTGGDNEKLNGVAAAFSAFNLASYDRAESKVQQRKKFNSGAPTPGAPAGTVFVPTAPGTTQAAAGTPPPAGNAPAASAEGAAPNGGDEIHASVLDVVPDLPGTSGKVDGSPSAAPVTSAQAPGTAAGSKPKAPKAPSGGRGGRGGGGDSPDPDNEAEMANEFTSSNWQEPDSGLTDAPKFQPISEPMDNCAKYNLKGFALVNCARYAAYNNAKLTPRAEAPAPPTGLALSADAAAASKGDVELIRHVIKPNFTVTQGQTGSCTQNALQTAARALLQAQGKNPGDYISMDGEEISEKVFNGTQGGQAMMEAAPDAFNKYYEGKAQVTTAALNGYADAAAVVRKGKPVWMASGIKMGGGGSWNEVGGRKGGGAEFGLTGDYTKAADPFGILLESGRGSELGLTEGSTFQDYVVSLGDDGENGHAYTMVGYIGPGTGGGGGGGGGDKLELAGCDEYFVVQNSWGKEWGEGGLAYAEACNLPGGVQFNEVDVTTP